MIIYCDGLTEPKNAGCKDSKGSWAFIVFDNLRDNLEVFQNAGYEGPFQTNNRCEYLAVGHACRWVLDNVTTGESVKIFTDSQLVVKQVAGEWNINKPHLRLLAERIVQIQFQYQRRGGEIVISWVPGEENLADKLTRKVYEQATGIYPRPRIKRK
jgi:ribonuclease HI